MFDGKTILLTGGTGSFGKKFTEIVLKKYNPKAIIIFSRDEFKQWEMEKKFDHDQRLIFFIGDIRDKERLQRVMDSVNIVVHAAALKHIPFCENNPCEAIKTNILGAQNIINIAMDLNIEKVIAISTDKATNPANLYGATKMCMEKLFVSANSCVEDKKGTLMSCTRYGNVLGSRGSVIPLFENQKTTGEITITDERMTRFFITMEQGVEFVIRFIEMMHGGEIFVPKSPSVRIVDLAGAIAPKCKIKYIGIRPGEKIHECLITKNESRYTLEFEDYFVIKAPNLWQRNSEKEKSKPLSKGFCYRSDDNDKWLTLEELKKMVVLL